jgi:hypothetical protein
MGCRVILRNLAIRLIARLQRFSLKTTFTPLSLLALSGSVRKNFYSTRLLATMAELALVR